MSSLEEERIRELEAEIERLTRVNEVLMDRVERSTDSAGSSYSLFESNLLLLEKIKEHTGKLEHVNRDLQREIRNRKQTEQALRWERNFVDAVLEAAGALILVLDTKGLIVRFNRTCEEVSGRRFEEVEGTPFWDLLPPEETALVRETVDRLVAGDGPSEGENHWISTTGEQRLIAWSNTTVDDTEGKVEYVVSIGIDITEIKRTQRELEAAIQELQDAQTQLVHSEKMAALGMLVAGIAHEINTPVGAIGSSHNTQIRALSRLKDRVDAVCSAEDPDHRKVISLLKVIEESNKVIDTGLQRVTTIVRRMRTFARLDEAELQESDIHECLEDTLTLVHHELKHEIIVHRNYGELPPIRCYPGQLNQVFLNLLINAKQAISGKGEITITTTHREGWVEVAVSDTGCGIAEDQLKKIFDPGFTTKGVGVGTGLGLSICYRLVQDHFGEITVESRGCEGSTFTVVLPTDLKERLQAVSKDPG